MDYKVMKRPMFKMGGATSAGTGITSGLETPRQNFQFGTDPYKKYLAKIPAAFQKRRTGLENQQSSLGPLALYQALSGGALEGVEDFGDLAMAFGNPAVLQAVGSGMVAKNKLQSSLDDVDLKEATTMATLYKPSSGAFSTRLKSQQAVKNIQEIINGKKSELVGLDPTADADKIASIKAQIGDLNQQMKVFISGASVRERAIELLLKGDNPSMASDEDSIQEMIKIIQGYKEGGRINKQMGGGMDMGQATQTQKQMPIGPGPEPMPIGPGPEPMLQAIGQDPFTILRSRLPQEISDEVVSLIAYNKKAFADFANIQDQDDVDLFNQKYNVQLVVDLASR